MIRVFISYAHDAEVDGNALLLAQRLRRDGIDCRIDAFINGTPTEGWILWMEREIASSDHVLLVCTQKYLRRFMGEESPGIGLGVTWESQLTRSSLYAAQGRQGKVVPVIFNKQDQIFIPESLRYQTTSYLLMDDYENLVRFITGQPKIVAVPVGEGVVLMADEEAQVGDSSENGFFAPSIVEHMATLDRHVRSLTDEQLRVIGQLRLCPRVRVSGIAGSGKTLVAAQKAILLARAGVKTLFLCHNPMLAGHVSELTRGSGVTVAAFTGWALSIAGMSSAESQGWSRYDEPTRQILEMAFDMVLESADRYDAVIVDEGQDFRDEWWPLVEAALKESASGILYIFHDDRQALLPHRARYPFDQPLVDLSRNCRNAGRIYEIMRCIHPSAPESDASLRDLGDVFVEVARPGYERETIRRALCWFPATELEHLTVLFAGGGVFTESIFNLLSLPIGRDVGWREEVRRMFAHARVGRSIVAPSSSEVDSWLQPLSYDLRPSSADIKLVQELAMRFVIQPEVRREILNSPDRREGLVWQINGARAVLRSKRRAFKIFASEIIMHFERETWAAGLPKEETVQFARDVGFQRQFTIPVYHVSEFKGLESSAILLYIDNLGSMAKEELLVGISRARMMLAIVIASQAEGSIPASLRRFLRDIERDPPAAHGHFAS